MKTAFIGLGTMGKPMAINLIKSGAEVKVWNRSSEKSEELREHNATISTNIKQAVSDVEYIITMLPTPESISEVALGEQGFLQYIKGKTWINTSTVNPSFAKKLCELCDLRKVNYLDAPVSGSKIPAEKGELTFLVGGEEKTFEQAKSILLPMGKKHLYYGKAGMGSSMKMIVNMMLAQSMVAFSEAVHLGLACGIEKETLMDSLLDLPVTPAFLKGKKEKITSQNFEPDFSLKWMYKDLYLASKTAYEHHQSIPLTSLAKELFAKAIQEGNGEEDFSAIFNSYK